MDIYDKEDLEIEGQTVKVTYYSDPDMEPPWKNDCGSGNVRQSSYPHREGRSDKRPGERPLNQADRNEYQFYYDWQEACKRARTDGWNAEPYDAPNRITRAVQANFDFIKGYLDQDWCYVGVEVKIEGTEEEDTCWGFETYKDYHKESARDMAKALVESHLKEVAESKHWQERDMVTQ